jgi:predicted restriction endonuclease
MRGREGEGMRRKESLKTSQAKLRQRNGLTLAQRLARQHPPRLTLVQRLAHRQEHNRTQARKRRAYKRNLVCFTAAQWATLLRQYGHRCVGCWRTATQLKALGRILVPDHIVPVVKGGLGDITNIQPLCHGRGGCNNRKGPKYLDFVIS